MTIADHIQRFLLRFDLTEERFGREAAGNPKLLEALRAGAKLTPAMEQRIRTYMFNREPAARPAVSTLPKDPSLPQGALPAAAQRMLMDAAQVGRAGSLQRASAINRAYRLIEEEYPQYLKKEVNHGY